MSGKKALIMVDLQNDFCPGGRLPVPKGDEIIPLANQLQTYFDLIIATQDWHPHDHVSFANNHPGKKIGDIIKLGEFSQILWPNHCEQGSEGAAFHPDLVKDKIRKIFLKGSDKNIDSYSAFFDNAHLRSTGLADYLRSEHVNEIYLMGLATDYCVKYSVLDACSEGFAVYVICDACRGIDLHAGDIEKAFAEMQSVGARLISSDELSSR